MSSGLKYIEKAIIVTQDEFDANLYEIQNG